MTNYEGSYLGTIDLQQATIHSDNSVYAQLTKIVGPGNVLRTAHRLGIASELKPFLSIGLGGQAVNPLEMARAFSAFANGGSRIDGSIDKLRNHPRAILAVGRKTSTNFDCKDPVVACNKPRARRVLREDTVAAENSILQRVVTQGTGLRAALPGRPAAGKTGTTENYGDAWFVGYTPQLVTAVWVGYPHKLIPMTTEFHGDPVAGGTFPAMIWKTFTEKALNLPAVPEEGGAVLPATAGNVRRVRAGRSARGKARARQRPLPRDVDGRVSAPDGRSRDSRTASPTRCRYHASSATRSASRFSDSSRSRSRLLTSTSPRSRGSGSTSCSRSTRHTGRCRRTTA